VSSTLRSRRCSRVRPSAYLTRTRKGRELDPDPARGEAPLDVCGIHRISRADLASFAHEPLKKARTWFTPDVILLRRGTEKYILKDFSTRPWLTRSTWGRFLVSREIRAYSRLAGIPGVPKLISVLGPYAFVIQWVDARPLPSRRHKDRVGMDYFDRVFEVLAQMHGRGVAHGDVRRRNVLIGPNREPYFIDFESAIFSGRGLRKRLFRSIAEVDEITILKIRHKYYPDESDPEEIRRLTEVPWFLRTGKWLKRNVYKPLSPKGARSRMRRWRRRRRHANRAAGKK
jgi:predicted Ser/Thr protein kinase